jgi:glycerol-3-phosphate dehydrogenase subunit C
MNRIKARPTDALSYDPNERRYWVRAKLEVEVDRVFDICHGCRLCFNLCPSFPDLFKAVDAKGDDVRNLTPAEKNHVIDLCYECKLCEVKCPYTPRDDHEFQLDFPALVLRARSRRTRKASGCARKCSETLIAQASSAAKCRRSRTGRAAMHCNAA